MCMEAVAKFSQINYICVVVGWLILFKITKLFFSNIYIYIYIYIYIIIALKASNKCLFTYLLVLAVVSEHVDVKLKA